MKESNNIFWVVTLDKDYSYDNPTKTTFLSSNEKIAKNKFKEKVESCIKEELNLAQDFFEKSFTKLEDISKHIKLLIDERNDNINVGYGYMCNLNYEYALDIPEDKSYAIFTISKKYELINNHINYKAPGYESVCVTLQKLELGKEHKTYPIPSLNNVSEIDTLLKTI